MRIFALDGLDSRTAGVVEGFNYSDANKNSGITWNGETFKDYVRDPRAEVPGTEMVFAGIENDREPTIHGAISNNSPLTVEKSRACPDVA